MGKIFCIYIHVLIRVLLFGGAFLIGTILFEEYANLEQHLWLKMINCPYHTWMQVLNKQTGHIIFQLLLIQWKTYGCSIHELDHKMSRNTHFNNEKHMGTKNTSLYTCDTCEKNNPGDRFFNSLRLSDAYIHISKLDKYLVQVMACNAVYLAPRHYLKQCGLIINWTLNTLKTIFQWIFNPNLIIFNFSFKKMHSKSSKCNQTGDPFCLHLNMVQRIFQWRITRTSTRQGKGDITWLLNGITDLGQ